jgi:predicted transport protein
MKSWAAPLNFLEKVHAIEELLKHAVIIIYISSVPQKACIATLRVSRDVTAIGHHGNGDIEVRLSSPE